MNNEQSIHRTEFIDLFNTSSSLLFCVLTIKCYSIMFILDRFTVVSRSYDATFQDRGHLQSIDFNSLFSLYLYEYWELVHWSHFLRWHRVNKKHSLFVTIGRSLKVFYKCFMKRTLVFEYMIILFVHICLFSRQWGHWDYTEVHTYYYWCREIGHSWSFHRAFLPCPWRNHFPLAFLYSWIIERGSLSSTEFPLLSLPISSLGKLLNIR